MQDLKNTQYFKVEKEPQMKVSDVIDVVYHALSEKGYNPVNQIVGYIMSGDPTYITSHKGARSMIMAVQLQITIVSINTPSACVNPAFTGLSHSAAAAAHGAEPEPASFENNPRFTPFISTAPNPPAATWRIPKASWKILANTPGRLPILVIIIKIVMQK